MIDLKIIVDKFPKSLDSRAQLSSILHDLYPTEKKAVNIALAVYDAGVAKKIGGLKKWNNIQQMALTSILVDEYGLQEQFAIEGISAWARAYGLMGVTKKNTIEQTVQNVTDHYTPDAFATVGLIVTGSHSDYKLESVSEGVVIKKFCGIDDSDLVVPNVIDGKRVIGIDKYAYIGRSSMKITISDGIEFIEEEAFANCKKLETVVFPETLKCIGPGAFTNCEKLESAVFPKSLKSIGTTDNNRPSNGSLRGAFSYCAFKKVFLPNSLSYLGDSSFYGCNLLKYVHLPENLKCIGDSVFSDCVNLSEIQFPLALEEIERYAFSDCAFETVVFNEGLKRICSSAFLGCDKLKSVVLPSTLEEIYEELFSLPTDLYDSPTDLIVYCYSGTYGYEYARKKGYRIEDANNYPR